MHRALVPQDTLLQSKLHAARAALTRTSRHCAMRREGGTASAAAAALGHWSDHEQRIDLRQLPSQTCSSAPPAIVLRATTGGSEIKPTPACCSASTREKIAGLNIAHVNPTLKREQSRVKLCVQTVAAAAVHYLQPSAPAEAIRGCRCRGHGGM